MELIVEGFRRFESLRVEFGELTVIVGPNGAGKTSLIEACHVVSLGRSYRTHLDRDLIQWSQQWFRLAFRYSDDLFLERSVRVDGSNLLKKHKVNQTETPFIRSLGLVRVVLFAPELVELITGSPGSRRRFLDMLLSSLDPTYADDLLRYQHALQQRNKLLFQTTLDPQVADVWEAALVQYGVRVMEKRSDIVAELTDRFNTEYRQIAPSGNERIVRLSYYQTVEPAQYADLLAARREADHHGRGTSIGPHRDDLRFFIDDRPAAANSSRGEQRSLLLALKRAELAVAMAVQTETPPLLLLDDPYSELDEVRTQNFMEHAHGCPTIITTTDLHALSPDVRKRATVIELK